MMWIILVTLVLGILIGRFNLIPERFQPLTRWITTGGLVVLLISMGASISSNPDIFQKIGQLGWQAFLLALFSLLGSIFFVWLVQKHLPARKKGDDQS